MRANDWNAEAVAMARYVRENMFEAHRGAMPWKQPGVSVIFGNDGATGEHTTREIEAVRECLQLCEIPILGFGVEPEANYSWAMLVQSHEPAANLAEMVWDMWGVTAAGPVADVFIATQWKIAMDEVANHGTKPETSTN
jgi:hypothetical protein